MKEGVSFTVSEIKKNPILVTLLSEGIQNCDRNRLHSSDQATWEFLIPDTAEHARPRLYRRLSLTMNRDFNQRLCAQASLIYLLIN